MENEKINTPAEILKNKIMENCGETLQLLLEERKLTAEKVDGLRARITGYEQDIVKFTQQADELQKEIDLAFERGDDPKALTKKMRVLKTSIDDCSDLIKMTDAQIEKITGGQESQKVDQKVSDVVRTALQVCKSKIIKEMEAKLVEVTKNPQVWADAVLLLKKSIPGFPKVETELCFIHFFGASPTSILIY